MELILRMTGEVAETNFDQWKIEVIDNIKAADRDLVSEEDFVLAKETITAIEGYEKAIDEAKDKAQRGTEGLATMFAAVDEIKEQLATTRLALEKRVKAKRAEMVERLINETVAEVKRLIAVELETSPYFGVDDAIVNRLEIADATKNKKTEEGMRKALSVACSAVVERNLVAIRGANRHMDRLIEVEQEYPGLFHDKRRLAKASSAGEIENIIEARISTFKLQQKEKEERDARVAAQPVQSSIAPQVSSIVPQVSSLQQKPVPQPATQQLQEHTPVAAEEPDPVEADFTFTVFLKCDVDTAKGLAKEISAYFGRRKEIVRFNLKRT